MGDRPAGDKLRSSSMSGLPARRIVGWLAYASGAVAAVGVVFIVGMFSLFFAGMTAAGERLGFINDVAVLIQYLLALPIPLVLNQQLQDRSPVLSRVAMIIGVAGMIAIVLLQYLLVTGVLTFDQQIGPVSFAFLAVAVWLVTTGYLGRLTGQLPRSLLMGVLGASYVGYPVWAFWLGRRLLSDRGAEQAVASA
jgi:hypothetical protein